jgi:hypothetical protein
MKQSDKALDYYFSLQPDFFDVLARFDLQQHEIWIDTYSSKYVLSLELWLRTGIYDDPRRLRLIFNDIQQLRFEAKAGYFTLPLTINSLRKDQWEYLRYHVSDRKEKIISFYSQGFEAQIIKAEYLPES